jgi:large subunit ribosomal protein L10
MPNAEKVKKVRELAAKFRAAQGTLFSDFRGLTVKDAKELRSELRKHDASFMVAKNTLTKLAAKEAGLEGVDEILQGPTGIVFADGDPIAGAKAFLEVARRFPALQLKGAYVEGQLLGEEAAKGLATVEPKEISLARIAGLLQAPLTRIAYLLQAPIQRMAYALAERGKQGDGPVDAAETAPEASASDDAAAAPEPEASPEAETDAPSPEASPEPEPESEPEPEPEVPADEASSEAEAEAPEAVAAEEATDTDTTDTDTTDTQPA